MATYYIAHHGILGQKWGKKNGPPYPLDAYDHSAAEKKAGKSGWSSDAKEEYKKAKKAALTKLNKSTNNLKNNGKQNDIETVTKIAAEYDKDLKIAKEEYKRSKTANKQDGLTEEQKKIIKIGAIATGVALASIGGVYLYKTGKLNGLIQNIAKNPNVFADGSKNLLVDYDVKLIPGAATTKGFKESIDDTIYWANKNARGVTQGRNHNCVSCAFATELRQRGYDVAAKENIGHYDPLKLTRVFGKPQRINGTTQKELEKAILEQGEGARGIFMGTFHDKEQGAHFFNYEVKDGVVHLFDGQRKKQYDNISEYLFFGENENDSLYNIAKSMFIRTDDKPLNVEKVMEYVEPNDYKHYVFSDKVMEKWTTVSVPKSARAIERIDDENTRITIRRGYMYVQSYLQSNK